MGDLDETPATSRTATRSGDFRSHRSIAGGREAASYVSDATSFEASKEKAVARMLNDPVVLVAVVGVVRLCDRVVSGWIAGRRDVLRGRIVAALVEVAGPGVTVVDGQLDGGFVAVCRLGVTP